MKWSLASHQQPKVKGQVRGQRSNQYGSNKHNSLAIQINDDHLRVEEIIEQVPKVKGQRSKVKGQNIHSFTGWRGGFNETKLFKLIVFRLTCPT